MAITTANNAKYSGLRVLQRVRNRLSVTVHFAFRERTDVQRRAQLLDEVRAWCENGGELTTNYRRDQRLKVICSEAPALGAVRAWTTDMAIQFTAFANPFWEDTTPTIYAIPEHGKLLEFVATPNGTADSAMVEAAITVMSAAPMTNVKISCDKTMIELQNIRVEQNRKLAIFYDAAGFLVMDAAGTHVLNRRTAASSDDLIARLRHANAIRIESDADVQAKILIRGCYV